MLVMRLSELRDNGTLTELGLIEALGLIESYVLRRAICGYQTRGYWQIFANLTYKISSDHPLDDLKVELARLSESARFPADQEFERELKSGNLYGLRVCRYLLEGLENHGTKEPTDTSNYSIEHILPQNERLSAEWRHMLGDKWEEIQKTWVHRLGNLTLTGYNTKYSDRPFAEKRTIPGGFEDSSVRLNKFVRDQTAWTQGEISYRTDMLAARAVEIWGAPVVSKAQIDDANLQEMRELAARRDVGKVEMSSEARTLFDKLRDCVFELDSGVIEVAEPKSVSYHGPSFFLEVLPRRYSLTLLLALDFNEIDDPSGLAQDATRWEFFVNARHQGGVTLSIGDERSIEQAIPMLRQAHASARDYLAAN